MVNTLKSKIEPAVIPPIGYFWQRNKWRHNSCKGRSIQQASKNLGLTGRDFYQTGNIGHDKALISHQTNKKGAPMRLNDL